MSSQSLTRKISSKSFAVGSRRRRPAFETTPIRRSDIMCFMMHQELKAHYYMVSVSRVAPPGSQGVEH